MTLSPAAVRALIDKKRGGGEHDASEIHELISGFSQGAVDEGPMSAWLMAVCFTGMTLGETTALTEAMARSGDVLDWSDLAGPLVDKHSTGGVGDAVTLAAVPLAAACGARVAKLSGRALAHTGGTIDKLECIPGLRTELSVAQFKEQVRGVGCCVAAATASLAPADKKLYALRDRTGTIASIPLIAASVMSKKIAGGAPAVVLDVKAGRGAFMPTVAQAKQLARTMVDVGARLGRRVRALVGDMNAPLADSVGDALELDEALRLLEGRAVSNRLAAAVRTVAAAMLGAAEVPGAKRHGAALALVDTALVQSRGLRKFEEMVRAQGGRLEALARSRPKAEVLAAQRSGYVREIDARALGEAVAAEKSGRPVVEARRIGVRVVAHVGTPVRPGDPLLEQFGFSPAGSAVRALREAFRIGPRPPAQRPLVHWTSWTTE